MKKALILYSILLYLTQFCEAQFENNRIVYLNCDKNSEEHYLSLPSTKIFNFEETKDQKNKDSIYCLVINYKECACKDYYSQLDEFKNIEIVTLVGNFQTIPKQLFKCKKIQQIKIDYNNSMCFGKIFEEASKITNLNTIKISNSDIGIFPESIKYLKNLENFHISNSIINGFGNNFKELINLKALEFNNCGLIYLPDDYINPNLTCLDISSNNFDDLPEEILKFENLEVFSFFYNYSSIRHLHFFCELKNLKYLYLGYLGVESLPNELSCVRNLEFLFLTNSIKDIDNISNFTHLKSIILSNYNGDITKIVEAIDRTKINISILPKIDSKQ